MPCACKAFYFSKRMQGRSEKHLPLIRDNRTLSQFARNGAGRAVTKANRRQTPKSNVRYLSVGMIAVIFRVGLPLKMAS